MLIQRNNFIRANEYLEMRRENIIKRGTPESVKITDATREAIMSGRMDSAFTDCVELASVNKQIERNKDEIALIDKAIAGLTEESRTIITLIYVEEKTIDEAAGYIDRTTTRTVYNWKNRAINEFAILYFGASAMDSV